MQLAYARMRKRAIRQGFRPDTSPPVRPVRGRGGMGDGGTVCPAPAGTEGRIPRVHVLSCDFSPLCHDVFPRPRSSWNTPVAPVVSHPRGHFSHARTQPAAVPATLRRGRHVLRAVREHRPRRRDSRAPPHRQHRGRRAHRRADAGEPVLRPLLRHFARRTGLRRPAAGDAAERQAGVAPAGRQGQGSAAVPAAGQGRRPGPGLHRGPQPRLDRQPPGVRRRPLRPVGTRQDGHDDGAPGAQGHPVPLRARRHLHRLRRLPLLLHRLHRPEPLLPVDRVHGQRRQGRRRPQRPGPRQRREGLQLDDVPRAAGGRGRLLEDLPGHRRRPGRGRPLGLAQERSVPRQLRRQLPAVLRTASATPSRATRCTRRPGGART
ncbi:hypothetical protein SRIMM317S_01640 [Streptomyces rimosus subsp. rimosus]